MKNATLKLVGYDRNRKIEHVRDDTGKVVELKPIDGTERSMVMLVMMSATVPDATVRDDGEEEA